MMINMEILTVQDTKARVGNYPFLRVLLRISIVYDIKTGMGQRKIEEDITRLQRR